MKANFKRKIKFEITKASKLKVMARGKYYCIILIPNDTVELIEDREE